MTLLCSSQTSKVGGNRFGLSNEAVVMSIVVGLATFSYESWLPQVPQN